MKIYLGSDHNGYRLRDDLLDFLKKSGFDVADKGDSKLDPNDDYPLFAAKVVSNVLGSEDEQAKGVLLCGSGQGMCIAANRYKGIRACLGYDVAAVRAARNDDDCNVLCLPASTLTPEQAHVIVSAFLVTPFADAPRFVRRNRELDEIGT